MSCRSATASSASLAMTASRRRSSGTANESSGALSARSTMPPSAMRALTVACVPATTEEATGMRVGFIGLGAMGLPMTPHLVEAGHEVTVASRSRGPIDAALGYGATEGDGPRGVAEASEITILCVPNSPEVIEVVDAALPALGDGKIVVDTSTIDPEVECAQHERVSGAGARYLEAPLSGGTVGAEKGTLTLMVG